MKEKSDVELMYENLEAHRKATLINEIEVQFLKVKSIALKGDGSKLQALIRQKEEEGENNKTVLRLMRAHIKEMEKEKQ